MNSITVYMTLLLLFWFIPQTYGGYFYKCYDEEDIGTLYKYLPATQFKATDDQKAIQQCSSGSRKYPFVRRSDPDIEFGVEISTIADLRKTVESSVALLSHTPLQIRPGSGDEVCLLEPSSTTDSTEKLTLASFINQKLQSLDLPKQKQFFEKLRQELISSSKEILGGEEDGYDFISVGGGIAGTTQALELGKDYKVLIIDANLNPSVFAQVGSFFLNSGNMTKFPLSPLDENLLKENAYIEMNKPPSSDADSAMRMGDYVLMNLYVSGAQVVLGSRVIKIGLSDRPSKAIFPIVVRTEDGRAFYTKAVSDNRGMGLPHNPFPDFERPSDGTVMYEGEFLTSLKGGYSQGIQGFQGKKVIVIGGGLGGRIVSLGLFGIIPQEVTQPTADSDSTFPAADKHLTEPIGPGPKEVHWFNHLGGSIEPGTASSPEVRLEYMQHNQRLKVNTSKAKSIMRQSDGTYLVQDERGRSVVADSVIYSTGYTKFPPLWSEEEDIAKANGMFQIGVHKGQNMGSVMHSASSVSEDFSTIMSQKFQGKKAAEKNYHDRILQQRMSIMGD